jgi:hypothetical protein
MLLAVVLDLPNWNIYWMAGLAEGVQAELLSIIMIT